MTNHLDVRPAHYLFCAFLLASIAALGQNQNASVLLHQAIQAQGGEAQLRLIHSIQWTAAGYRNELEESERPEGPYSADFLKIREIDDYANNRFLRSVDASVFPLYKDASTVVVADNTAMQSGGGPFFPGSPETVQVVRERMALNPERLLLTALDAADVHSEQDITLQGIQQNVLVFDMDGAPVHIYLNSYTHLPTAVDYSGPLAHTNFYAYLGDVTLRTYFSLWWLAKGGIHLPMQRNLEVNGMPDQMLTISKVEIDGLLPDAELKIPPTIKAKFQPNAKPYDLEKVQLGDPAAPPVELAPGIVFIPGSWNTTIIRQDDGVVILEAPISSGYAAAEIAEAHKRFPGVPIKGVVTTSDSWPHIAGIREFVAEGISIYALNLNKPILERLIAGKRTTKPDLMAKAPKPPDFRLLSKPTTLGTEANRIMIIPIRGETSERQMMIYFPEHHLLYGSDPFQKLPDGSYFYPQTVSELTDAVAREKLTPKTFFMMHMGPTPWADLATVLEKAKSTNTPDGKLQ